MSLAVLFHLLCAQHVSDINISIFRSSFCRLKPAKRTPPKTSRTKSSNTQRTENKMTDVVIHQHSRKHLMMDILMSETCWAHKKWNKTASDIKLVFHSSTINSKWSKCGVHEICETWTPPKCRAQLVKDTEDGGYALHHRYFFLIFYNFRFYWPCILVRSL